MIEYWKSGDQSITRRLFDIPSPRSAKGPPVSSIRFTHNRSHNLYYVMIHALYSWRQMNVQVEVLNWVDGQYVANGWHWEHPFVENGSQSNDQACQPRIDWLLEKTPPSDSVEKKRSLGTIVCVPALWRFLTLRYSLIRHIRGFERSNRSVTVS